VQLIATVTVAALSGLKSLLTVTVPLLRVFVIVQLVVELTVTACAAQAELFSV
jgi:hypothetical protein